MSNPRQKLTPKQVRLILGALEHGMTQTAVARLFDVSQQTVSAIVTGRRWRRTVNQALGQR